MKRDWDCQIYYFSANEEHFQMYDPQELEENEKSIWQQMVNDRKHKISEELSNITGSTTNVKKVPYSNRFRISFPFPVEACSFNTVDLNKHLISKHNQTQLEAKLQMNYFNVIADFLSPMNTYQVNRPTIYFKCSLFFDRVDHHLPWKHLERNTEEYYQTLASYRKNAEKVLASSQIQQQKIHNVRDLLKCITNISKKSQTSEQTSQDRATESSQSFQDRPHALKTTAAQSLKSSKTNNQQPSHETNNQQPGPSYQKTQDRGKYVPSKSSKKPLLKYKKEIITALRKQYNSPDRNIFRYYYDNTSKVTDDFKNRQFWSYRCHYAHRCKYKWRSMQVWFNFS